MSGTVAKTHDLGAAASCAASAWGSAAGAHSRIPWCQRPRRPPPEPGAWGAVCGNEVCRAAI